jgi:hypothetical protein
MNPPLRSTLVNERGSGALPAESSCFVERYSFCFTVIQSAAKNPPLRRTLVNEHEFGALPAVSSRFVEEYSFLLYRHSERSDESPTTKHARE